MVRLPCVRWREMVRPAGENKGGGPVGLGGNQSLHFLAGSVVQEDLGVVKVRLEPAIIILLSKLQQNLANTVLR